MSRSANAVNSWWWIPIKRAFHSQPPKPIKCPPLSSVDSPDVWVSSTSPKIQSCTVNDGTPIIVDGKSIAKEIKSRIAAEVRRLRDSTQKTPGLGLVLVGKRTDSHVFVGTKLNACKQVGIETVVTELPEDCKEDEAFDAVERLNKDPNIHGIIVQLPLPKQLDEEKIMDFVRVEKDVDGFHPLNIGNLAIQGREPLFIPCATRACIELLVRHGIVIKGKNIAVIGRSKIVGLPTSLLLQRHHATVCVVHAFTENPERITLKADIVVSDVGVPNIVRGHWLKPGAVVIDMGTNSVKDERGKHGYRLVGDVCFEEAKSKVSVITPVPGGVGPVTISIRRDVKNSGKTTFSRHLVNVLLQRFKRVAYLDTDVGQTEFTPPGLLSLNVIDKITPDLTIPCLKTPQRCFFFGDISSKRNPSAYLTCIYELYDYYRQEYYTMSPDNPGVPLVINTPGWVKGIGYNILVDMLKYVSPMYVVKICISAETKNLPSGTFWVDRDSCTSTVIEVNSARQDALKRSVLVGKDARLVRELRVIAYFRQCFPSDMNLTTIKELANALAAHPPYEINVANIKIKHLHCQVPSDEIFYSLNATIVGLGASSQGSKDLPHCVGLGIVRGIDATKGKIYIITPVSLNSLEKVDILLQGFIQIPTCFLQVQGCISPYMSQNVLTLD